MDSQPLVAVVVVHWGSPKMTIECIRSLGSCQYGNLRIVVVDNCPERRLWQCPSEVDHKVTYILNASNTGYCGGNNIGIIKAQNLRAKYILLLNNDTIIDKDMISICVIYMEDHPNIWVISPKILYCHNPQCIDIAGGELDLNTGQHKDFGKNEKDVGQCEFEKEITFATGCAFFSRARLFDQIGLFDDKLFCYCEDVDISRRIVLAGMRMRYLPGAKVWHKNSSVKVGGKGSLPSRFVVYYYWRNHFYILRRYISEKFVIEYIRFGYKFVWSFASLTLKHKRPDLSVAMLLGLLDSIAGRMGNREYLFFRRAKGQDWGISKSEECGY